MRNTVCSFEQQLWLYRDLMNIWISCRDILKKRVWKVLECKLFALWKEKRKTRMFHIEGLVQIFIIGVVWGPYPVYPSEQCFLQLLQLLIRKLEVGNPTSRRVKFKVLTGNSEIPTSDLKWNTPWSHYIILRFLFPNPPDPFDKNRDFAEQNTEAAGIPLRRFVGLFVFKHVSLDQV